MIELAFILAGFGTALYYYSYSKRLEDELNYSNQMVEDMINGGSESELDDMGYAIATDSGLMWLKFQPKRKSCIYISKEDFLKLIKKGVKTI